MEQQVILERLVKNLAEIITEDEFRELVGEALPAGRQVTHYIGFEISGYVHIGQGIMSALVIKDLQDLGVKCTIWLADWHTWINDKLDGTKETAQKIGKGYFTEAIKASLLAVGADPNQVEFRLASDWYEKDAMRFWETVMRVAQHTTDSRIRRSISIMGREDGENVQVATLMYPLMQVADIFYQNLDIAHAAMDQRKAHVIMRDVAEKVAPEKPKPVALHHPLVASLDGEAKMSKSRPDSAVFVHDSEEEIERKIKKAFAQEKNIEKNPILNWSKNILFWDREEPFQIERKPEHGGHVEFTSFPDLESAYAAGNVHPMDLKSAVATELIDLLKPVRDHFAKQEIAAKKAELDKVLSAKS